MARTASAWSLLVLLGMLDPDALFAQRLDLSVAPAVVTFPSTDPDIAPTIASAPVTLTYRVRQYDGPWTLTVLAGGDLISGLSTVDISNVTWTATPAPPFQNGTLSKTVAQRLASGTGPTSPGIGPTNPGQSGQLIFRLANSWNHDAGAYTQIVTFTLSAP